ncbi:FHA domain-containing protein [Marinobacter zhejiangensis]|uniref:FHA domain-containing protein n=1 Tax=Marinobacter zhejiangensis TaxID=488535 RepID=A0A1I4SFU9_9GAMM|nr:FHA domain-containing protein [Marinobacter zhejiangensis]SFM63163.1 FHA domain-containing protein [Marinobacter zhejiangensis]
MTDGIDRQRSHWIQGGLLALALMFTSQALGAEGDTAATTDTPEAVEQEAPAPAEPAGSAEPTEPADSETAPASEPETETELPAEDSAPVPDSEADAPAETDTTAEDTTETAPEHSNRNYLPVGIVALLAVLALLIRMLGRNRKPASPGPAPKTATSPTEDPAAPSPFGYFHIMEGGRQRHYTLAGETVNVGRSASNDLVLSDDTVSASHLVIKRERNGSVLVTDLNSSNGTRVNGSEVSQAMLVPGDTLELGDVRIRFETRAPADIGASTRRTG